MQFPFLCICFSVYECVYPYTIFAQHIPKQKTTKGEKNPNVAKYINKYTYITIIA